MYKAVFQNSKVALVFAALTVISAVSMVGTSEDGGLVTKVAEMAEARREMIASEAQAFAESQGGGDVAGSDSEANRSVFGDYEGDGPLAPGGATRPASPGSANSVMTAPLSATAVETPRGAVSPIAMSEAEPEAEPVITERDMTIVPE